MVPIPTIDINCSIQEAAKLMIDKESGIVAVLSEEKLIGVVTDWDITQATAEGVSNVTLKLIMTKDVISVTPDYSILDIVRELEQYQISAMPVVKDGEVLGKVSSDLITQRYMLSLLQDRRNK
jgi:CBS domain-containing protein